MGAPFEKAIVLLKAAAHVAGASIILLVRGLGVLGNVGVVGILPLMLAWALWDSWGPIARAVVVVGCILVPVGLLLMAKWSVWASPSKPAQKPGERIN